MQCNVWPLQAIECQKDGKPFLATDGVNYEPQWREKTQMVILHVFVCTSWVRTQGLGMIVCFLGVLVDTCLLRYSNQSFQVLPFLKY